MKLLYWRCRLLGDHVSGKSGDMTLEARQTVQGVMLAVKVVPGASISRIVGLLGGALKVQIAAAPEKGKANKALRRLLADVLGVPVTAVQVVKGQTRSHKEVLVEMLDCERLGQLLEPHLQEDE